MISITVYFNYLVENKINYLDLNVEELSIGNKQKLELQRFLDFIKKINQSWTCSRSPPFSISLQNTMFSDMLRLVTIKMY